MPLSRDEKMMLRCFELAEKGRGAVQPNPMVGAVLTLDDKIIGEGYHQHYGGPHAEVHAISAVADRSLLSRATLYCNLEPCSHFGKTPPCADLVVASGIRKVVVGAGDPNPLVSGRGLTKLREHGIEVVCDVLKEEAIKLNARFYVSHILQRPYVILKWAESADGFIARSDGSSRWISNEASRALVHRWRSEESAIMVGFRTALIDNPQLTVRLAHGRNPLRVVLDRGLSLPATHHLFDGTVQTLVFNEKDDRDEKGRSLITIDWKAPVLPQILIVLQARKVQSLFVEGGKALLDSFIAADLWDEARVFRSQQTFGGGLSAPDIKGISEQIEALEGDQLSRYENNWRAKLGSL